MRFQQCGLATGSGGEVRANHGPMAAEALVQLGHPALLVGFVDIYAPRLPPWVVRPPLAPAERSGALGRSERAPEWVATFRRRLADECWRDVLVETFEEHVDALAVAGASPWLRVAHALHGLAADENPVRVQELSFGLGYWCANAPPAPTGPPVAAPLERIGAPLEQIGALCSDAAARFLAEPTAALREIRVLTAASALRLAAPHLPATLVARAAAALVAFAAMAPAPARSVPPTAIDAAERGRLAGEPAELRYRAACSIEEHCIEFAAACLREHGASGDGRLLEAAADAVLRLDSGRY